VIPRHWAIRGRLYVRAFRNERRESWFAGVERAFRHFGGVTEEVLLAEQMTIRLARDHGFADSPLEGDGFEPSVPVRQAKLTRSCR
jgi:hypothetical protein